jgi:hypothetical protein
MSIDTHNLFKPIRNKLGEYDILSLVINASKKLHEVESKHPSDFRGWLPWHILLLIKWSYEYGGLKHPPKPAHEPILVKLMNLIKSYEEECQSFSLTSGEPSSVIKFFRILAFQQF